jgi:hypothetical protein
MKVLDAFPSKYLKASHLEDREVRAMIERVDLELVGSGKDAAKKPILYFKKFDREMPADSMVLNVTNAKVISAAYGDDSDGWENKIIVLYPAMVQFGSDMVEAIRVKISKATVPAAAKPKAVDPPPAEFDQADDMNDQVPF